MSTASSRVLMQLFVAALLLVLRSDTLGHADVPVHGHHSSHPGIAAANHSALLQPASVRYGGDTAPPQLLASEASLPDCLGQSAPAPIRDSLPLCSYEHTTGQEARPPPLQA